MTDAAPDIDQADEYREAAAAMVESLAGPYVPASPGPGSPLITQSVYDMPNLNGVDEGTLWGNYYYLEAITRLLRPEWKSWW